MDNAPSAPPAGQVLSNTDIMGIIPHRYPILMVDKAVIVEPGKKIIGYKSVSGNEPYFQGHFPGRPIMPGVLIVCHDIPYPPHRHRPFHVEDFTRGGDWPLCRYRPGG